MGLEAGRRLSIAVLVLVAIGQAAVLGVEWWPFGAGLTQAVVWLVVLAGLAGLFVLSLLLILIAWVRRNEASDFTLLKRTTAVLLLLPLLNLYFFFWFPTPEKMVKAAQRGHGFTVKRCLFWGIDPDATHTQVAGFGGRGPSPTALRGAAAGGHLEIARALLAAGAELDAGEYAALLAAMHNARPEMVQYLLGQGAGFEGVLGEVLWNRIGRNPRGRETLAALLDSRPEALSSPWFLLSAAQKANPLAARIIADVDVGGRFGPVYELYRAIVRRESERALLLFDEVAGDLARPVGEAERLDEIHFFQGEPKPMPRPFERVSPERLLFVAARHGMAPMVEALLVARTPIEPPIDEERRHIQSPLSVAVQYDHLDVVVLLLAAGADVTRYDRLVGHPLYASVVWSSLEIMERLLDAGAPIDAPGSDIDDYTPLMQAARHDRLEQAKLLVARGADPTIRRDPHSTACTSSRREYAVYEYLQTLDCGPR